MAAVPPMIARAQRRVPLRRLVARSLIDQGSSICALMSPCISDGVGATPEFDPTAGGTKFSGTLTIAFVFAEDPAGCPETERRIDNMHVVLTLSQGNNIKPFNTDFVASGTAPFCFLGESQQTQLVLGLIRSQVIPHFYNGCIPGSCPDFKVKSITDFLSSGTGAISMNITLAVQ